MTGRLTSKAYPIESFCTSVPVVNFDELFRQQRSMMSVTWRSKRHFPYYVISVLWPVVGVRPTTTANRQWNILVTWSGQPIAKDWPVCKGDPLRRNSIRYLDLISLGIHVDLTHVFTLPRISWWNLNLPRFVAVDRRFGIIDADSDSWIMLVDII